MRIGKKTRIAFDVALTLMIVFEMFIQYTGNFLHEVIGFAFFATVIAHLAFSAVWMKSTAHMAKKGKISARNIALAVMGSLLVVDMIVLGVSSVAISQVLYSVGFVWTLGSYALWAGVHSISSYVLCALVVVHLGMHWAFLATAFKVPYDPSRRRAISAGVYAAAALGAIALGMTAMREASPEALALTDDGESSASGSEAAAGSSETQFRGSISDRSEPSAQQTKRKRERSGEGTQGGNSSAVSNNGDGESQPPASDPAAGQSAISEHEQPSVPTYENESDIESGSASETASGICTLCRKQCPLSDPKCDKPYRAGLL